MTPSLPSHSPGIFIFLSQLEAQVAHIENESERASALKKLRREAKLKGTTSAVAKADEVQLLVSAPYVPSTAHLCFTSQTMR